MIKQAAFKKQFFTISRWLHIYVAMTFFTLLIFFCITGITLNHATWLEDNNQSRTHHFQLPKQILRQLQAKDTPDLTSAQAYIEAKTNLSKPRSIDIDIEAGEISFDYPLPAGSSFILINLASGGVAVEHSKGTLWVLLNDLHKGRHTGIAWSWLIDISAIAIALFSFTGLIILFQHHKKRGNGLMLAAMGFVLPIVVYFIWVPRLALQ